MCCTPETNLKINKVNKNKSMVTENKNEFDEK